jgi:hypothetical protein
VPIIDRIDGVDAQGSSTKSPLWGPTLRVRAPSADKAGPGVRCALLPLHPLTALCGELGVGLETVEAHLPPALHLGRQRLVIGERRTGIGVATIGAVFDIVRRVDSDGDATAAAALTPEPVKTRSIHHQVSIRAQYWISWSHDGVQLWAQRWSEVARQCSVIRQPSSAICRNVDITDSRTGATDRSSVRARHEVGSVQTNVDGRGKAR